MNKELLEKGADTQDTPEENNYQRYLELGGIVNEKDYNSALARLEEAEIEKKMPNRNQVIQVKNMTKNAGIELGSDKHAYRTIELYSILRSDRPPEEVKQSHAHDQTKDQHTSVYHDGVPKNDAKPEVKHHHSEMTDQRILVEALRMLGDVESRDRIINAHPNISFKYERGDSK